MDSIKPRKKSALYSKELVDKISEKLSLDYSFKEISEKYEWAPTKTTMWKWATTDDYAKYKFKEAQTLNIEQRKRDKINELRNINLDAVALQCQSLGLTRELTTSLFKAKVEAAYKQIELAFRELEIEIPKKYRKQIQQDVNVGDSYKTVPLDELRQQAIDLLEHPSIKKDSH